MTHIPQAEILGLRKLMLNVTGDPRFPTRISPA